MPFRKIIAPQRGFALIVTLSLMVLLTVIAVGLLSLSSISLRGSSQGSAMQVARANARLALMLAIGDLQKQLGPDTRVSARADILNQNNAPLLGAWKSWEGTDHDSNGRPIAPTYADKKAANGRFLSWMVSGADPAKLTAISGIPVTTKDTSRVPLVGVNSLGSSAANTLQIHLAPVPVTNGNGKGAYAWWVGGENQKARLPRVDSASTTKTNPEWAAAQKSNTTVDPKPFGMESLLTDPAPATKAITLKQSDFVSQTGSGTDVASRKNFYDLSVVSTGLLTNTATGGWRKDLSLFTERYDELPSSNMALFRLTPDKDDSCSIPSDNNTSSYAPDKAMIYPWATYRGDAAASPGQCEGAIGSWRHLADFALSYRHSTPFSCASNMQSNNNFNPTASSAEKYAYVHRVRRIPVLARVQWIFSYTAYVVPGTNPATYYPGVLMTPIVTLWNPYNVALTNIPQMVIHMGEGGAASRPANVNSPLPCVFKYRVGTSVENNYRGIGKGRSSYNTTSQWLTGNGVQSYAYRLPAIGSMAPGSTLVMSPTTSVDGTIVGPDGGDGTVQCSVTMGPGFTTLNGFKLYLYASGGVSRMVKPASDKIQITGIKFDNQIDDGTNKGVGVKLSIKSDIPGDPVTGKLTGVYQMAYPVAVATSIYPEIPEANITSSPNLQTLQSGVAVPFFSAMFGMRMASNTNIAAKGFIQTNPLTSYTEYNSTGASSYLGTNHPVNMPFDFSFSLPGDGPSGSIPEINSADNSGYIISGFTSGDGLSRSIVAEVPAQPLASLAELQHWDVRHDNPMPPYAFNIIGNSEATPLIPKDSVVNSAASGNGTQNLQHDDAYCTNHVLFDDWFFSSLAAGKPAQFGATGTIKGTFTDFIKGTVPLTNRAYRPLAEDGSAAVQTTGGADTVYSLQVQPVDSWRKIASRLEVEGMFNVNSTSVAAWRALLGHARNQKIPYYGNNASVTVSGTTDYPINRYSVAADVEAGKSGFSGGFSKASQFMGYRKMDDKMLDELADKIVAQVRLRGPFLSLSEFVNRQLSGDTNLALAGAVQTALNALGDKLYGDIEGAVAISNKNATSNPKSAAQASYQFNEAANGICIYGLPGWTRQADVLRPLAPILSARDDTFTIRAYGDARDASGKVTVTATCEAMVRRTRAYCDPQEAADLADPPTSVVNKTFGRRFQIISFRWLAPKEI